MFSPPKKTAKQLDHEIAQALKRRAPARKVSPSPHLHATKRTAEQQASALRARLARTAPFRDERAALRVRISEELGLPATHQDVIREANAQLRRAGKMGQLHHSVRAEGFVEAPLHPKLRGKSYRVSALVGGGNSMPVNLGTPSIKAAALKMARDFMKGTPPKTQYDSVQILPLVNGKRDWNTESMRWLGVVTNVRRPSWVRGQGIK